MSNKLLKIMIFIGAIQVSSAANAASSHLVSVFTITEGIEGQVLFGSAPISVTASRPGLNAWADSQPGILKVNAFATEPGGAVSLANFTDNVTIITPGTTNGIARGSVSVSGTISHSTFELPPEIMPDDNFFAWSAGQLNFSIASFEIGNYLTNRSLSLRGISIAQYAKFYEYDPVTDQEFSEFLDNRPGETIFNIQRENGISDPIGSFSGTYDVEISYTSGVPFRFQMEASCSAATTFSFAPASCDFGSTAIWNGLSGVFDESGNPLRYSLFSETGRNFADGYLTSNIPEPESWGMLIIGFGTIGSAMRARRTVRTGAAQR